MTRKKIVARYLRQVKRNCSFSFQKRLMTDLENHLFDYLNDNPDSTIVDVADHLGSPEKFADEHLLAMDETARRKAIQKARWVKWSCLLGVAAIVLIIAMTAVGMLHEISQTRVYYYYEYTTENNIEQN